MDQSNREPFIPCYDTFLLDSSSPPLVADPGPTAASLNPTATDPLSGGGFDPTGLDWGEPGGITSQQGPAELLMGQMDSSQAEEMNSGMKEQVGSDVPDAFIANNPLHDSTAHRLQDFMGGNYTVNYNAGSGFQEPVSGNIFDNVGTEAVADKFHLNPNQLEEPSILTRIVALEAKVNELLDWKAKHTRRSIELSKMMDEILGLLYEH
ncbi:hypothetical protein QQX98_007475 [Neonectria punicea]|uniref:Uncharacterized protein n=1 Tax=Neonectria punicea TaxID=979145 RepID=A0ABR1GXT8_9HYPO